jgi:hypothetical protein
VSFHLTAEAAGSSNQFSIFNPTMRSKWWVLRVTRIQNGLAEGVGVQQEHTGEALLEIGQSTSRLAPQPPGFFKGRKEGRFVCVILRLVAHTRRRLQGGGRRASLSRQPVDGLAHLTQGGGRQTPDFLDHAFSYRSHGTRISQIAPSCQPHSRFNHSPAMLSRYG